MVCLRFFLVCYFHVYLRRQTVVHIATVYIKVVYFKSRLLVWVVTEQKEPA